MSSSQVAMLVEVELDDGKIAAGLFAHRKLSDSVGFSIAAFARCVIGYSACHSVLCAASSRRSHNSSSEKTSLSG